MQLWQHLAEQISQHTGTYYQIIQHSAVGGGCINQAYKVSNGRTAYFVKTNDIQYADMFATEALSLQEIADSHTLLTPRAICFGTFNTQAYLILEYLDLSSPVNPQLCGQQLAAMHRVQNKQFGWQRNNTIGSSPQLNQLHDNWVDFWREQRLLPQIRLAEKNGYGHALTPIMDTLLLQLPALFIHHEPLPSLLHGDLWGGNVAGLPDGTPVIFDPALYYGDRETDIAMTYLFGGFSPEFYAAYNEAWPLSEGFLQRKPLYNLYHIINHLNLFGEGYLQQAISMAEHILEEI